MSQFQPPSQWQAPQYPPPPETYYPPQAPMPAPPPKKRMRRTDKIALWVFGSLVGAVVLIMVSIAVYAGTPAAQSPTLSSADQQATANANASVSAGETAISSDQLTQAASTPAVTPTPPPTVTQSPTFATFTDGIYQVGKDIQPGTYRTRVGSTNCYYARLKSFDTSAIISNNNTDAPAVITILRSDTAFQSENCGTWTSDLSRITDSKTTFGDGIYIVGTDIAPGTYKNVASTNCYYARLSAFDTSAIISNNNTDHVAIVTIYAADKGFQTQNCGTWTKI